MKKLYFCLVCCMLSHSTWADVAQPVTIEGMGSSSSSHSSITTTPQSSMPSMPPSLPAGIPPEPIPYSPHNTVRPDSAPQSITPTSQPAGMPSQNMQSPSQMDNMPTQKTN